MKQFAKLSLAMIVITGFIASALNPHSIQAQAPKPVTPVAIVSPIPVPISGDVGAAQSGPWSVAVSNTPTVNVNSLPLNSTRQWERCTDAGRIKESNEHRGTYRQ